MRKIINFSCFSPTNFVTDTRSMPYGNLYVVDGILLIVDTFNEWLFSEMRKRRWTQADLAQQAGITRGAVSHLFSNTRKPGVELLKAVAAALGLPRENVYRAAGLLEAEPEVTPRLREWIKLFVDADEETRELLLDHARFFTARATRDKKS